MRRVDARDLLPSTPIKRAELLVGLAALLPGSVEAAMASPRTPLALPVRSTNDRALLYMAISVLYQQVCADYFAIGAPLGSDTLAVAAWLNLLLGIARPWS